MTARSLEPSTPRGEATRQRVLEAAERVFGDKGYYGASVTEITRAAGVAQGTFYLYFRGKKEIFLDLVDSIGSRLLQSTLRPGPAGSNFVQAQRDGFGSFFSLAGEYRHIYRIIQECDRVDPLTYRRFYRNIAEAYARRAADAMERGEIEVSDPEVLAYALLGVGHFVAMRYLLWDDAMREGGIDAAVRFVQAGLRPTAEA
jgi:AcrR family transcriptional regulator